MPAAPDAARGPRIPDAWFTARYALDPDPWGFASSPYEDAKYAATLAALGRTRYRRAFEPGCSIGVLTRRLAARCDAVVASDVVDRALDAARARTADLSHVDVARLAVPDAWPDGTFDLVVVSELGYYLDAPVLDRLLDRAVASLDDGGELVAVHWRGRAATHRLSAEAVHAAIADRPELEPRVAQDTDDYLLSTSVRAAR